MTSHRLVRLSLLLSVLSTAAVGAAAAQDAPNVRVGGIVSATLFAQDRRFGLADGQGAQWAEWTYAPRGPASFAGADVRNTRITLTATGPSLPEGWRMSGVVEADFFGHWGNADDPAGAEPRLRLAYADLMKGGTMVRIGRAWTPLLGVTPASLSHLAFPLGHGSAGVIGWTHTGIFLHQALGEGTGETSAQLQLAAFYGSPFAEPDNSNRPYHDPSGWAPQMEARLDVSGVAGGAGWTAYMVGHLDRQPRSSFEPRRGEFVGSAIEVGGRVAPGPLTLHGNAYMGRGLGRQLGHIAQGGDIGGWGGWAQAGYALTPRWSAWLFHGVDDVDDEDLARERRHGRAANRSTAAMLRYSLGAYAVGVEWLRASTTWKVEHRLPDGTIDLGDFEADADQLALSVYYAF